TRTTWLPQPSWATPRPRTVHRASPWTPATPWSTGAFIANGTRLTLTAINPDGSAHAVVDGTGGTVTLDPDYLASSTELGYATTAHRAQGVTVDTGHTVV
ncbi:hypothetical protein D9C01_13340, partial [Corynebacterium diphtheriae]